MPKISIIVPVYKVEAYLDRCVESILAQTFTDFELILVDDGSPDNCPIMCDEWAKKDSRIVVIHQQNGGLSAARNAGIDWAFANSDSEWLSFVDSDDWVHPCFLEYLYRAAIESECSISICDHKNVSSYDDGFEQFPFNASIVLISELIGTLIGTVAWNKLYSKQLFNSIRYPIGKLHEDEHVTYLLMYCARRVAFVDAPLYQYFQRQESITHIPTARNILDGLEGLESQLVFWGKNNELEYIRKLIPYYLLYLYSAIKNKRLINTSKGIQKRTKKTFKRALVKYRKLVPLSASPMYYELAFPRFMYLYWTYKGIIGKFKKVFRSGKA